MDGKPNARLNSAPAGRRHCLLDCPSQELAWQELQRRRNVTQIIGTHAVLTSPFRPASRRRQRKNSPTTGSTDATEDSKLRNALDSKSCKCQREIRRSRPAATLTISRRLRDVDRQRAVSCSVAHRQQFELHWSSGLHPLLATRVVLLANRTLRSPSVTATDYGRNWRDALGQMMCTVCGCRKIRDRKLIPTLVLTWQRG